MAFIFSSRKRTIFSFFEIFTVQWHCSVVAIWSLFLKYKNTSYMDFQKHFFYGLPKTLLLWTSEVPQRGVWPKQHTLMGQSVWICYGYSMYSFEGTLVFALENHHFQHILGLSVTLDNILFQDENVRNIIILALTGFFLNLGGNASNCWSLFNKWLMKTSNLVPQRFGGDNRNFFDYLLVCIDGSMAV